MIEIKINYGKLSYIAAHMFIMDLMLDIILLDP